MLELCPYASMEDKNNFIAGLDLKQSTLIVSDLVSKQYWQQFLLNKDGAIAGPLVLRAEDFWKLLVQRSFPEINIVSNAWMTTYLKHSVNQEFAIKVGLPYAKPSSALRALNDLLPILCHPESQEVMENWFEEACQAPCAWEKWYYLATSIWETVNKQNLLLSEWSSAFLLQQSGFEKFWQRDLIVDLGPEIRTMEAELLQALSGSCQVKVLAPNQSWLPQFSWISYPYNHFKQRSHKLTPVPKLTAKGPSSQPANQADKFMTSGAAKVHFQRLTAALAEVKFAVGQIRQWLEAGHDISKMAIIAPDIEQYWPVLRWHLIKESIPFEKAECVNYGDLGTAVAWIAFLKKACGHGLRPSEYELAEFHPLNFQTAKYSVYKSLWSKRPFPKSLSTEELAKAYSAKEFLEWAIQVWPHHSLISKELLEICKKWLLEANKLESRSKREWIEYLEDFLNQQEFALTEAFESGVGLFSLMSGIPPQRTLQIYFGCSESQLKSAPGLVNGSDVLSLQHHTGHLLAHPDRDFREYQLNAMLGYGEEQFFIFAETDFKGSELVPSVFWLNGRERTQVSFHQMNSWNLTHWEFEQIHSSASLSPIKDELVTERWSFTLSPASLKSYVDCPFKFFAEKGLKLIDPAIVDLDLDARTLGSLQHRLLELLTQEPFTAEALTLKLNELVEQTLSEHKEMFFSGLTKELIRLQLQHIGQRFIDHEQLYRKEFPRFYTMAREAWFKREIIINDRALEFRGKIDRIDLSKDQTEAIVIDYKNDTAAYRNAGSWLDNLEFQLPAYTKSVESGLAETENREKIPATKVVAAHYYSLKDFSRKGFTLDEASNDVVIVPTPKSKISSEEKEKLIEGFNEILMDTANKILNGDFRAIPHPHTDCKKCPWRYICRTQI